MNSVCEGEIRDFLDATKENYVCIQPLMPQVHELDEQENTQQHNILVAIITIKQVIH